eukprot:gene16830-22836_t
MAGMMGAGSLLMVWAWLSLALFVMGFVYGPLGAFLPSLFPPRVRYTGASMVFNVGGIIGGGLTPVIAQSLANAGGLVPVGGYLAGAAALSFVGIGGRGTAGRSRRQPAEEPVVEGASCGSGACRLPPPPTALRAARSAVGPPPAARC